MTSEDTIHDVDDDEVRFVPAGAAELKGVATAVKLYRVVRRSPVQGTS